MSALEDFQKRYGAAWGATVNSEVFAAALTLVHNEKLKEIAAIHDDQIHDRSQVLLADLRGHLRYEAALLGLHEKKIFVFQELGPEDYGDPVTEAFEQAEADRKAGLGEDDEPISVHATEALQKMSDMMRTKPKPKKKPPKRKKR